jgi:ELWxxDGT repeat protein
MASKRFAGLRYVFVALFVVIVVSFANGPQQVAAVAQTSLVKDLGAPASGNTTAALLTEWNGAAYFVRTAAFSAELWRSDGTETGTFLLKEVGDYVLDAFPFKGQLFVVVAQETDALSDGFFWKTDGTPEGTVEAFAAGGNLRGYTVVGDYIYYVAGWPEYSLYKSDGTAAGTAVVPLNAQTVRDLDSANGLVFVNSYADRDGSDAPDLIWRSDGTPEGTFVLVEDAQGYFFEPLNGKIYFSRGNLWETDGTVAGTLAVPTAFDNNFGIAAIKSLNNRLFLALQRYNPETEQTEGALWVSDGTTAGTVSIKEGLLIQRFIATEDGELYIVTRSNELWRSDGTSTGTVKIADNIHPFSSLEFVNGILYYTRSIGEPGPTPQYELWENRGTPESARRVSPAGLTVASPQLTALGDILLFTALDAQGNADLWKLFDDGNPYPTGRVTDGLQALYEFNEGTGNKVNDTSGVGTALNLTIKKPSAVQWQEGSLKVSGLTTIASLLRAKKLIDAAKASDQFTVEAWITPANLNQYSARILTISSNPTVRNVTLAQGIFDQNNASKLNFRLRTSNTANSGKDLLSPSGVLQKNELAHLVVTYDGARMRIYIDGVQVAQNTTTGTLDTWNNSYPLVLAGELTGGRNWRGTYHLVAFYSKALSAAEVQQNYEVGAE